MAAINCIQCQLLIQQSTVHFKLYELKSLHMLLQKTSAWTFYWSRWNLIASRKWSECLTLPLKVFFKRNVLVTIGWLLKEPPNFNDFREKTFISHLCQVQWNILGLAALLGGSVLSTNFVAPICDMTSTWLTWKDVEESVDTAYYQLNLLFQMNTRHLGWHFISQKLPHNLS